MIVQLKSDASKIHGLNKDALYRVLGIEFHSESSVPNAFRVMVRLLDDAGIPALFNWSDFSVIDNSIEADFVVRKSDSGFTEIAPSEINVQGFWESFFNDDEASRRLFKSRFPELADQLF